VGLASSSNTVANQYKYTPWGLSESTSETVAQPLRFMAREYDATTGLYYVRARSYDPALAWFNSEDPIGLDGGINNYAFVVNSPPNSRDASGLDPNWYACWAIYYPRVKEGCWLYKPGKSSRNLRSWGASLMRKIALSTLGILAFSTGCSDVRQSQRITNHSSPCISFGADSSGIADAALAALLAVAPDSANLNKLKVERFESDSGGTRVTFVPGILMSGGGGAVWVPNSGCAVVRELFE